MECIADSPLWPPSFWPNTVTSRSASRPQQGFHYRDKLREYLRRFWPTSVYRSRRPVKEVNSSSDRGNRAWIPQSTVYQGLWRCTPAVPIRFTTTLTLCRCWRVRLFAPREPKVIAVLVNSNALTDFHSATFLPTIRWRIFVRIGSSYRSSLR